MSSTISALPDGGVLQDTDRIPIARSPFAVSDNFYILGSEFGGIEDQADGFSIIAGDPVERTFTVTGSDFILTGAADSFTLSGGTGTPRTLTLNGSSALNQNLETTSSPTFAAATITGAVGAGTVAAGEVDTAQLFITSLPQGAIPFGSASTELISDNQTLFWDNTNKRLSMKGFLSTFTTAADTLILQAYDTLGAAYINFLTLTAGNPPTADLNTNTTIGGANIYRVGSVIPVNNGGTGTSTIQIHHLIIGNDTNPVITLAPGAAGTMLTSNGAAADPSYQALQATVAQGGTGRTTLTANNVLLGNGTSAINFVAPGTSGNLLTSNGTTWVSQAPAPVSLALNDLTNCTTAGTSGDVITISATAGAVSVITGGSTILLSGNTKVGHRAGVTTTAGNNVFMGLNAASGAAASSNNVAIGANSFVDASKFACIAIGCGTTTASGDGGARCLESNTIAIGFESRASGDGTIAIGESCNVTSTAETIAIGQGLSVSTNASLHFGTHRTTGTGTNAYWSGTELLQETSSIRFKERVEDYIPADDLNKLRPRTFEYKENNGVKDNRRYVGLIAEEVEKIYPEFVSYDTKGQLDGIFYDKLTVLLIDQVQRLRNRLDKLERKAA